jgi:hypothetical protein
MYEFKYYDTNFTLKLSYPGNIFDDDNTIKYNIVDSRHVSLRVLTIDIGPNHTNLIFPVTNMIFNFRYFTTDLSMKVDFILCHLQKYFEDFIKRLEETNYDYNNFTFESCIKHKEAEYVLKKYYPVYFI